MILCPLLFVPGLQALLPYPLYLDVLFIQINVVCPSQRQHSDGEYHQHLGVLATQKSHCIHSTPKIEETAVIKINGKRLRSAGDIFTSRRLRGA
ncbi:hypothetical protein DL93DRAFT_1086476 [Clavulina sp. PMI_390]|nr:hypothetical protein DL93DRAFT_1086476 [Clavulina sp. PMI_390]